VRTLPLVDTTPSTREEIATDPPQPEAVVQALEALLSEPRPGVDPWWRAGNDDALGLERP
jgi:hypothetical protein